MLLDNKKTKKDMENNIKVLFIPTEQQFQYSKKIHNQPPFKVGQTVFFCLSRDPGHGIRQGVVSEIVRIEYMHDMFRYEYKIRFAKIEWAGEDSECDGATIVHEWDDKIILFKSLAEAKETAIKWAKETYDAHLSQIDIYFEECSHRDSLDSSVR